VKPICLIASPGSEKERTEVLVTSDQLTFLAAFFPAFMPCVLVSHWAPLSMGFL